MRSEFQTLGIPVGVDPTFVFFSLDVHHGFEPLFFAGFTCTSFNDFPNKMKNVIEACIETDDIGLLTRKLSEIFRSRNIIPHDHVDYQLKQTITHAITKGESSHPMRGNKGRSARVSTRPTSILFLAADPTDASRLRLGEEFREIQGKLKLAQLRDQFKLELPQLSLRPADITQALLDSQPQIVHFSGHGASTGELCFESQTGQMQLVQPHAVGALFEQFARQVSCVLLNACYSEVQAKAVASHIEYVIGMSQEISDKAAIAFTVGFYQALGAGRTIENAYKLGCVQIRLQGIPEHLTPVLLHRSVSRNETSWIAEVIEKKGLPGELLEKLSHDEDSNVRLAVVKNPDSPSAILERLADDPSDDVKTAVLRHHNCPMAVLVRYAENGNSKFRKIISERQDLPQEVIDIMTRKKRESLEKHRFINGICARCGCTREFVEYFGSDCIAL